MSGRPHPRGRTAAHHRRSCLPGVECAEEDLGAVAAGAGVGVGRRDQPDTTPAGWTGGSVGIGVDPVVLSEVIFPVLTGAVAQIMGTAAGSWWQRVRRRRTAVALSPETVVTISAAQLEQIKAECVRSARALGMLPAKAQVLGDAVLGVLSRRNSEDSEPAPPAPPHG